MRSHIHLPLLFMACLLGLSNGCFIPPASQSAPRRVLNVAAAGVVATLQADAASSPAPFAPNETGDAPDVRQVSVFSITDPSATTQRMKLQIDVSQSDNGAGEYENRPATGEMKVTGGFRVMMDNIPRNIENRRYIRFTYTRFRIDGTPDSTYVYYVRYVKTWRLWTGVTSPVLYRTSGSVGAFGAENFAPSIAGGPRHYLGGGENQYIGFNPLLTVYRWVDDPENAHPYALSVGGVIDLGGYFQIGANYQFHDKKAFMLFGVRPEVWKLGR